MGRHSAPPRWRRHARTTAPALAAGGASLAALAASTGPHAVVSSVDVETTTGSLPVVTSSEARQDPPTVVLPRITPADVAAEALATARKVAPTTTTTAPTRTAEPVETTRETHTAPATGTLQSRIAAAAQTYVGRGIPYRYGGKNCTAQAGCDCSALTWRILQDAGMNVPYRNSAALAKWATYISRSQAVPGDLVLFRGHVGVYMGGGMMIDHGGPGKGANYRKIWGSPRFGRVPGA